ncbi:MAG: hypothetical protein QXQ47_08315, partial [Candidatus Bathyarchaeia archaeon]
DFHQIRLLMSLLASLPGLRLAAKTMWGWLPRIRAWFVENGIRDVDRVGRRLRGSSGGSLVAPNRSLSAMF